LTSALRDSTGGSDTGDGSGAGAGAAGSFVPPSATGHPRTLLETMLMDGGSDAFSLETGIGAGGSALSAGTGSSAVAFAGTDSKSGVSGNGAFSTSTSTSATAGGPTDGNAITKTARGTGNRGILNSSKRDSSRLTARRERDVKQAKSTPAYCLLEPEGQSTAFWGKASAEQNLMRVRLDVRSSARPAALTTHQWLLQELQGTYSGNKAAAAGDDRQLVGSSSMSIGKARPMPMPRLHSDK